LSRNTPDITLSLEADRRLPYHEVEAVLAALGEAGLQEANLIALRQGTK
jgi:biopolymer transport protein ExbD